MMVFLDDMRQPEDCVTYMNNMLYASEWHIVKSYYYFVRIVTLNYRKITHISFDHDIHPQHYIMDFEDRYEEPTGLDCAIWVQHFYAAQNWPLPTIFVHSMNTDGRAAIKKLFNL